MRLACFASCVLLFVTLSFCEAQNVEARVGTRVAVGQQLISQVMTSIQIPLVYLLNENTHALPEIHLTEKATPLITIHLTLNNTYLTDVVVSSTYAEFLEETNTMKIVFAGMAGHIEGDFYYYYYTIWRNEGQGSLVASFSDSEGWIELKFDATDDGHVNVLYVDSKVKLENLELQFDGSWSWLLNLFPGVNLIIKRRINKTFHDICERVTNIINTQIFDRLPIMWGIKLLKSAVAFDFGLPEDPKVTASTYNSFSVLGTFVDTKFPSILPPFPVTPELPMVYDPYTPAASIAPAAYYPLPVPASGIVDTRPWSKMVDIPPQVQIMLSEYTFNSLGWALYSVGGLDVDFTEETLPDGVPVAMNTLFFGAIVPGLLIQCPDCPVKIAAESETWPAVDVTADGARMTHRIKLSWFTLSRRTDDWQFSFSMWVDFSGSLLLSVDPDLLRVFGDLQIDHINMTMDQSDVGTVHLFAFEKITNRLIQQGIQPLINSVLHNIGVPLPELPFGVKIIDPEMIFTDGMVVILSDALFPFPRYELH